MRLRLTAQQDKVLRFIEESIAHSRVAPSYEAMAAHVGLKSRGNIHRIVSALELRGYIRRIPRKSRSITLARPLAGVPYEELLAEVRLRRMHMEEPE